jgi:Zn-dependent M28 family amino/carboxypeptidase
VIFPVAHLASVAESPGATDGASRVAAFLETARALRAEPGFRNSFFVLLTEPKVHRFVAH